MQIVATLIDLDQFGGMMCDAAERERSKKRFSTKTRRSDPSILHRALTAKLLVHHSKPRDDVPLSQHDSSQLPHR